VTEQNVPTPERPSLRIAALTIENFRTFRERTVIPFSGGVGAADAIATFHGDNGSGKSNAIAALELLLRAVWRFGPLGVPNEIPLPLDQPNSYGFVVSRRDGPSDARATTEIAARFADASLGSVALSLRGAGNTMFLKLVGSANALPEEKYRSLFQAALGPNSRPMASLNASRRASRFGNVPPGETIQPALAEALLAARLSRDPDQRARWRDFEAALLAVPAFTGMDISIDRPQRGGDPELTFERRGKSVLGLDELSSGERQLVVLFAAVLLADAAIVAIEEPELSLDAKSQRLFYEFLARLVEKRRIDQAIIESHVAAFDGPNVIRFQRDPGEATKVSREPTAGPESIELAHRAAAQGAKQRWVTGDGFTRLPDAMRQELEVSGGKHIWFLRGPERWEAWPEEELERMVGGAREAGDG
jgi:energy-coupling factor transporter ATP-binding protein EcfA2